MTKLSVINVSFLNDESLADCAILCALNSEMLLQSISSASNNEEKNSNKNSKNFMRNSSKLLKKVLISVNERNMVIHLSSSVPKYPTSYPSPSPCFIALMLRGSISGSPTKLLSMIALHGCFKCFSYKLVLTTYFTISPVY